MSYPKMENKWYYSKIIISIVILLVLVTGCGRKKANLLAVTVNVTQVIKKDTPLTYEFIGQVKAQNEVQIRAKIAGAIVAKMVSGGASVNQGQLLFQIDRRQYEAALLTAKAQLAQSQVVATQAHHDLARYQALAKQGLLSQQDLDNAISLSQQDDALVEANQARVAQAEDDLQDTSIRAPFNGRIDVNDLSLGNFVDAGQTVLATLSSTDPVFIQFSISENEYLRFVQLGRGTSPAEWFGKLQLILSDGSTYPVTGKVVEVDRGLAQDTGTLTLKALFKNPRNILVPGMFARITATGETRKGALLIPKRALQQLLDKTFVAVVSKDNKADLRPVIMGPQIGDMWVVEKGLTAQDRIVVDGFQKIQRGIPLKIINIKPEQLQLTNQN